LLIYRGEGVDEEEEEAVIAADTKKKRKQPALGIDRSSFC